MTCARCHRLGMPMRVGYTKLRHAIDDAQWPSRSDHRSGNCQLGVSPRATRLRAVAYAVGPGQYRGQIRSDSIPSRTMANACLPARHHRRPQTTGTLRQVAIFSDVGSPMSSGCQNRDFLLLLPCAIGHAIGIGRGDTYVQPTSARWSPLCPPRDDAKSQNASPCYGVDRSHWVRESDRGFHQARGELARLLMCRRVSKRLPRLCCVTLLDACTYWDYYIP